MPGGSAEARSSSRARITCTDSFVASAICRCDTFRVSRASFRRSDTRSGRCPIVATCNPSVWGDGLASDTSSAGALSVGNRSKAVKRQSHRPDAVVNGGRDVLARVRDETADAGEPSGTGTHEGGDVFQLQAANPQYGHLSGGYNQRSQAVPAERWRTAGLRQ